MSKEKSRHESLVTYRRDSYVGFITLNRPGKRNAMNLALWNSLDETFGMAMTLSAFSECIGEEKVLIVGMNTGAKDPAVCYEIGGHWMLSNVYDPLVKFKPGSANEIEPCIGRDNFTAKPFDETFSLICTFDRHFL
jgi:hypothetical protein